MWMPKNWNFDVFFIFESQGALALLAYLYQPLELRYASFVSHFSICQSLYYYKWNYSLGVKSWEVQSVMTKLDHAVPTRTQTE